MYWSRRPAARGPWDWTKAWERVVVPPAQIQMTYVDGVRSDKAAGKVPRPSKRNVIDKHSEVQ